MNKNTKKTELTQNVLTQYIHVLDLEYSGNINFILITIIIHSYHKFQYKLQDACGKDYTSKNFLILMLAHHWINVSTQIVQEIVPERLLFY